MMRFLHAVVRIVIVMTLSSSAFAQVQLIGSDEYGRIFDLVYDQNVSGRVYAIDMANHLLVSNDNAQSWEVFYTFSDGQLDDLRGLNDTHLTFVRKNSANQSDNTLYFMELETGDITPIQRPFNALADDSWTADYSIYAANPDIIVYDEGWKQGFTSFESIYITADGGQTWRAIYNNWEHDSVFINNVLINPGDPDIIYLSRGNGPTAVDGGFYMTKNGGQTWNEHFAGELFRAITVNPENHEHIMIGPERTQFGSTDPFPIFESTDGGGTWSENLIGFDDFYRKHILEISFNPFDSDHIIILETNEIAVSRDGGQTWDVNVFNRYDPNEYNYGWQCAFNPANPQEVLITSNWYPQRSLDGGETAERMKTNFFIADFVALSPEIQSGLGGPMDSHLYYGVQFGMVKKNMITGEEIEEDVLPVDWVTINGSRMTFDSSKPGRMAKFQGGFPDRLMITEDNGENYFQVMGTWFDQFYLAAFDPNRPNTVWASYEREGTVVIDYGVENPNPWNVEKTYLTLPGQGDPYAGELFSLWFNPDNQNEVVIGKGGQIFHSGDYGQLWVDSSNGLTLDPNNGRISKIVQSPAEPNTILLATDQGVFRSTYRFDNWENILPAINVRDVVYDQDNEDVIVAAVYSSQVTRAQIIYSTDGGESWTYIPTEEIEQVSSGSMAFEFNETGFKAYLATAGLGVITYDVTYEILNTNSIENTTDVAVSVYPNPVQSVLNIGMNNGNAVKEVAIYNLLGAEVKRISGADQINVSDLSSGIYLVNIRDDRGNTAVRKIIKK